MSTLYLYTHNSVALIHERTIPTKRSPLVGEVSTNFYGWVCLMASATDSYGCILSFLDRSHYYFFQVTPQLYSRGWVDPDPDPLLLKKSDSAWNWTRTSGSVAKSPEHQTTEEVHKYVKCHHSTAVWCTATQALTTHLLQFHRLQTAAKQITFITFLQYILHWLAPNQLISASLENTGWLHCNYYYKYMNNIQ
jgi:hypothetical protein